MDYNIITEEDTGVKILALSVNNGVLVLVSDSELLFGTTALALPSTSTTGESISSINPIFGAKDDILAKSIAERVCKKINKIVIASVFIKNREPEAIDTILKLLKKVMERL
ncbi:MAG: hypothetical protein OdinLCB4_003595 [Candidatus Odinarchaeum yellowstonii]|uniref:Prenylated flavin chaperone LpdD-like domain-containing protein n=1 Tax=Odinarchaeota yellowstonii (strain LCB_4) TaxID=1841599 RepID=A0AAF0D3G1_ODILC|nr:MAG: hypothetical protein OdinLCB4_003595 [Candidatus Odinarchaeum yellowstonii]